MFYRFLHVLMLFCVLNSSTELYSNELVISKNNSTEIDLSGYLESIIDSQSVLTFDEIQDPSIKWNFMEGCILSKPISNHAYWYKIDINNSSDDFFLLLDYPLIELIDVYFVSDSGLIHKSTSGTRFNFNQREIKSVNHVFKIPKGSFTCFIQLENSFNLQFPLKIINSEYLLQKETTSYLVLGWNFGVLILLLVIHLLVYLAFKERIYIYYSCYMLFLIVGAATHLGLTGQFLWPLHPVFNDFLLTYTSFVFVFMGLLIMDLLKIKINLPNYSKVFYLFIFIFTFSGVLLFFNRLLSTAIFQYTIPIFNVFLFFIGVKTFIFKRDLFSIYFLGVWSIYLICIVIYLMDVNGFITSNLFTRNSVFIGYFFEAVMFTFLLIYRFRLLQDEKNLVQINELNLRREKEEILQNYSQSLEEKVNESVIKIEKYQSDLVQSEKMNSLAKISSAISNEINTAVHLFNSSISDMKHHVDVLKDYISGYNDKHHNEFKGNVFEFDTSLLKAKSGVDQVVKITDCLRAFTKSDANLPIISSNLNKDLNSLVTLQKALLPPDIKVDMKFGELPDIHCNAKDLNLAFLSVFEYAVNSITLKPIPKGLITIETKLLEDKIHVLFNNDGILLTDDVLKTIFNPFHLDRVVDSRGLGMSAAYRIIKENGGHITVDSQEGQDTLFTISLSLK